jgi:hypothetical protein
MRPPADADSLRRFLEAKDLPRLATRKNELANLPLIRTKHPARAPIAKLPSFGETESVQNITF